MGAYYQAHPDEIPVTRQAVYDKLKRLEPQVPAALVHYSAEELLPCVKAMGSQAPPLLPRYRVRVLDGNHLAGTEHRIFELRRFRAAVLPGQALVFYDPRFDLMTDVIPCEDAYAQERSLLDQALNCISARDCILADRNFCTTGFLFGIRRRGAFFVIRQHASTLSWELRGKRRLAGQDGRGRDIYEQAIRLTDPETGETFTARRITIALDKPTKDGETELHILTNLPRKAAGAVRVADLYSDRWTIETGFQHLTDDLRCEIDTLGYPKAALFGFCTACVAYNAVSVVKAAIRAAQGKKYVEEELSMYYLTLEVSQMTAGMMIAIPAENWGIFRDDVSQEVRGHPRRTGAAPRSAQVRQAQARAETTTAQEDQWQNKPSCIYGENTRHAKIGKTFTGVVEPTLLDSRAGGRRGCRPHSRSPVSTAGDWRASARPGGCRSVAFGVQSPSTIAISFFVRP